MDPDKYQQAWQAQSSQTRVTVDADLLLKAVQRNQQEFRAIIFLDYFGQIGISLPLLPVWIYLGIMTASPWTWYLMVPVLIWEIGFILVVRGRHRRTPTEPSEPLLTSVKESLALVEHQTWLVRNALWWHILPTAIALLAFFAQLSWLNSIDPYVGAFMFVILSAVVYFMHYINQRILRTQYEPRREELISLLAILGDETTDEVSGEYPILMSAKPILSRRRMFVAILCCSAIMLSVIVIVGMFIAFNHGVSSLDQGYPKKSPFAAVRWQQSQPEVKVGDEWFKLVSIDDLPADKIVAFSQRTYRNKWQKRFEEDLVELLTRMGHPPRDMVTLVVQSLTSSETRKLEGVPITEANRRAIRAAAQTRETSEP